MTTSLLRRTVAGLFMVGIPGPRLDEETGAFLREHPPAGVVLFRRNVRSAGQLRRLVDAIHAHGAGPRPLVAIDHEGGRVHRLGRPFTHFPPMEVVGSTGDPAIARAVGRAMGRELSAIGVDLDFAPVLDVRSNPRNRVIGDRAFGRSAEAVVRMALPFARGLLEGGVVPCGKHFPGHGDTTGDSHAVLPRLRHPLARLRRREMRPFVAAIREGMPALMTSHVLYSGIDPRRPATLSPRVVTDLLRRRLGFRGAVFSDDMHMAAVARRGSPGEAAVEALRAGCDALLFCQSLDVAGEAMLAVERAVMRGRLPAERIAEALGRIQQLRTLLARLPRPQSARLRRDWPAHRRLCARLLARVDRRPEETSHK